MLWWSRQHFFHEKIANNFIDSNQLSCRFKKQNVITQNVIVIPVEMVRVTSPVQN